MAARASRSNSACPDREQRKTRFKGSIGGRLPVECGVVVYVQPGDLPRVVRGEQTLVTILGSCVAACLWDRRTGFGGMTHALLPRYAGEGSEGRFADSATRLLIQRLHTATGGTPALVARVFGGASMSELLDAGEKQRLSIGDRNARETCAVLEAARIPVLQLEVGGALGRRIAFEVATGAVAVKPIARV